MSAVRDDSRVWADLDIMSSGDLAGLIERLGEMKKRKEVLKEHEHKIFFSGGYWMTYVVEDGKRKRIKRKSKKDLEDYLIRDIEERDSSPTIREVFTGWNDGRLASGRVMGSTHLRDRRFFERYFGASAFSQRRMRDTTPQDWARFLQTRFDEGLTVKQWAGIRGITRAVVKYSVRKNIIHWRYDDVIDLVDIHFCREAQAVDGEEILYSDELSDLRDYCREHWDVHERCIWLISYTGMRIGEAVALKAEDIDLEQMTITVRRRETRGDEQGRPRLVVKEGAKTQAGIRTIALPGAIADDVKDIVRRAEAQSWEYLFCQRNGQRLSAEAMRRRLREIEIDELGMETVRPPHKLRKTVASILCDSGMDDKQITAQLGHTDIQTTHQYYDKDRSTVADRVRILDGIPEMGIKKTGENPV